jgi:FkbM family methyltransferase
MYIRKIFLRLTHAFPNVRDTLIAIRDYRNTLVPAQETSFGFKFAGPNAMVSGTFEQEETPIIQKLISKNDIFINIGANVGYYCCFAALAKKLIIAFEPHTVNSRILLRNLEANQFSKYAEVYPTAVGAENGILRLYGSGTAASLVDGWAGMSSDNATLVPVVTLDGVLAGRFEDQTIFILIDVEGAEFSVIQGAVATLQRSRKPWWMIEICITDHQPSGVKINPHLLPTFDLLDAAGYEVWTFSDSPRRIPRDEVVKIVETKVDTIKFHNFLCVEPACAMEALEVIKN